MSSRNTAWITDANDCAERIVSQVGNQIKLGLPLGLGKANSIFNALYAIATRNPKIDLRVFTALTLGRPTCNSELERRFLDPLFDRLAGSYPELAYLSDIRKGRLPDNISVHEFYFPAGRRLNNALSQQLYMSTNYTHAVRDLLSNGINVITQLVAHRETSDGHQISLSCNPDLTLDLIPALNLRRNNGERIAIAGQINDQLPFMLGPAVVNISEFDFILHGPQNQFDLLGVPKQPISLADYAIALNLASLICDGGTLQIGIGSFADALTHALRLRHLENTEFRRLVSRLGGTNIDPVENTRYGVFEEGLYACSEMLVEGLLELKRIGVIKRRAAGMDSAAERSAPEPMVHSAFFLGSKALYRQLRNLSEHERSDIAMTAVSFVNQLYGSEADKRQNRRKARFVNKAMMATALGAIVSDALEDGRVVSGVGGQYNFVAQAHELEEARSIIALDAVRHERGRAISNIVWNYGHTTIPRHLRDIVVTEYGIADLRGKADRDVVEAMLNITDSRFQESLLTQAKKAGKIEKSFALSDAFRQNYPGRISEVLGDAAKRRHLLEYPLGTEMTSTEIRLVRALKALKPLAHSRAKLFGTALLAAGEPRPSSHERACLDRLDLATPRTTEERLMRRLVLWGLRRAQSENPFAPV